MAQRRNQQAQMNNANRMNEYFVPRDGIDREVITSDICRYLGNDALVRPGNYTDDNGRQVQGYFITAYRNLTSAMIADLKADSARWDQERRKHQSGAGLRYQDSSIRESRYAGYAAAAAGNRDSYDNTPRYPGNDAPGYSSGSSGSSGMQAMGAGYTVTGGYMQSYPASTYQSQQTQGYAQTADPRYTTGISLGSYAPGVSMAQERPYHTQDGTVAYHPGASYVARGDYQMDTAMGDAPPQPAMTTGYNPVSARGTSYSTANTGYGNYQQQPSGSAVPPFASQPVDNFYGRGGAYPTVPATTQPFSAPSASAAAAATAPGVGSTYSPAPDVYEESIPPTTRAGTNPTGTQTTQMPNTGSGHRDRDRGDRDRGDRDRDRDRGERNRADRDRDERPSRKGHHNYR